MPGASMTPSATCGNGVRTGSAPMNPGARPIREDRQRARTGSSAAARGIRTRATCARPPATSPSRRSATSTSAFASPEARVCPPAGERGFGKSKLQETMPDPEFAYDVFLSFASADEEVAREVWRTLEAGGLRVFWSTASLDVAMGQSWVAAIQENLERSRHFVLFWTAQAKVSPWVQAEYETFYGQCYLKDRAGRRLVVLPDGEEPIASLPPFLRSLQVARTASEMVGRLGGGVPLSRGVASGWLGEGDRGGEGWASSWSQGADRFGEFGNFKVADALQRMRWIEPGSF